MNMIGNGFPLPSLGRWLQDRPTPLPVLTQKEKAIPGDGNVNSVSRPNYILEIEHLRAIAWGSIENLEILWMVAMTMWSRAGNGRFAWMLPRLTQSNLAWPPPALCGARISHARTRALPYSIAT